jgi:hypothetical protein
MSELVCPVERSACQAVALCEGLETSLFIAAGEEFKYPTEILLPRLRDQNDKMRQLSRRC